MKVKRWLSTNTPKCGAATLLAVLLAGCSSLPNAVNPIAWYRDLSGASKNDALDKDQSNQQNLEAGGKAPYPNLASVPNPPDRATSAIDRDALQKSLIADRTNAQYNDEQLRAGTVMPGTAEPSPPTPADGTPPAAGAGTSTAAQQQAAAVPKESTLVSPTIANVPQGEAAAPPPPPPEMPPLPKAAADSAAAATAPAAGSAPMTVASNAGVAKRANAPASSVHALSVVFADGSAALPDADRDRLSELAAIQRVQGGEIRLVGHALPATGGDAAQQPLAAFTLALNRAKAVAQLLSNEGVSSQSIAVETAPNHAGDATGSNVEVFLDH